MIIRNIIVTDSRRARTALVYGCRPDVRVGLSLRRAGRPRINQQMSELDLSTKLAIDRTRVAYDRTMMAWIRTATSLITFGFSIYKFFQIELGPGRPNHRFIGPREFAIFMVMIGLISLVLGVVEHRENMQSLMKLYPEAQRSRTGVIAALVAILGILALCAVLLRQ
jgi:putative membrane protein